MRSDKMLKFERTLWPPVVLTGVTAVLFVFGFILSLQEPDHIDRLKAFIGVCLVAFHVTFYLLRNKSSDKGIKASDYVFLTLAFGGIYGAVDVQANMAKFKESYVASTHSSQIEAAKQGAKCKDRSNGRCVWELQIIDALEGFPEKYDHSQLGSALRDVVNDMGELPTDLKPLFDAASKLYNDMQEQVYRHLPVMEMFANFRRLLAFYVLAIGIALRVSRVSAEIFEWHVPKDTKAPKAPRGAQNAVWLRRKWTG